MVTQLVQSLFVQAAETELVGLGVTLVAAAALYLWKESFLPTRGWIQDMFGQMFSMMFLGYLLLCAYCAEYAKSVNGAWYRPDYFVKAVYQAFISRPHVSTTNETPCMSVRYFAEFHGFVCEEHDISTDDGFILPMQRIYRQAAKDAAARASPADASFSSSSSSSATANSSSSSSSSSSVGGFRPVLVQHGLMQSSGIFVTSERADSLAFYLADLGYDVWLGNNRTVLEKHAKWSTSDERFWDWSLDEMGKIDFPNQIDHVLRTTNHAKLCYIGHSQGTAQAFIGLSEDPELSQKISLFVALAPAFYIGPLGHWALDYLSNAPRAEFRTYFGDKAFIPIMCVVQRNLNVTAFASVAYHMFAYLFNWGDALWDKTRKNKYFMFTPRPASCKLIQHWCDASRAGQLVPWSANCMVTAARSSATPPSTPVLAEDDPLETFPSTAQRQYDLRNLTCPIALMWGSKDKLVLGQKLTDQLQSLGATRIVHAESIQDYEHMDLIWGMDCRTRVFDKISHLMQDHHQA